MDETPAPNSGIPAVPDKAIDEITRALIGTFIKEVENTPYGDSPIEKIRNFLTLHKSEKLLEGVGDLSKYLAAHAAERQAKALEQIAAHVSAQQIATESSTRTQAITENRESKLEYLTLTYSLPTPLLTLLWAVRGILVDASIKSLSVPERLDPYRRVTTEELSLALRMSPTDFLAALPRDADGSIDFDLLEDFDILHYGGNDEAPDDWLYGG